MEELMKIAQCMANELVDCRADDITDHTSYYTIREFEYGEFEDLGYRVVCANKFIDEEYGRLYYGVYCSFEDDESSDWKYIENLSVDELFKVLKEFYYSEKI